jgi:DNA gyrase subunit A
LRLKEVSDFRDETDKDGLKLTLDLKRGTDPDALMKKLFHLTPLEDDFSCNFNVLIDGHPRTLGVVSLLNEWIAFRTKCVKRELSFERKKKQEKLHLLIGLGRIILDIDKAVRIIRETTQEKDVVPNLMQGFSIDEVQAEYIAEIKLRNLNREYLLNRIQENKSLQEQIQNMTEIIEDPLKLRGYISEQLKEIKKKYGKPRMTQLIYETDAPYKEEAAVEQYRCMIFLTSDGYFKKIKLQSLRGNDQHRLKEGDRITFSEETSNTAELLFFTDKAQVYKAKLADFDPVKSSDLGVYAASELSFDADEHVIAVKSIEAYNETDQFLFVFENGKAVRIPANSYDTKTNRKKLSGAFASASPAVGIVHLAGEPKQLLLVSDAKRALCIHSDQVTFMTTRSSKGTTVFQLKGKSRVVRVITDIPSQDAVKKYRKTPPSTGAPCTEDLLAEK